MSIVESPIADTSPAIVGEFPCTQAQLRYWIQDQLSPGNPALNVTVRWEIRGKFRASSIEAGFRTIIQRHEMLRTRVIERDGTAIQQVLEEIDFKMAEIDLRNMPRDQRQAKMQEIEEQTGRAPFDLRDAGLLRASLLMVENNFGVLLITAHHICFDGSSIRVLGQEVGEIASAIDAKRAPNLPELPLQYGDYALWQEEFLAGYNSQDEKAFWLEELADVPYFEVPSDKPRTAFSGTLGNIISVEKSVAFGEQMEEAARQHQVTKCGFGAAIVSVILSRFTGSRMVLLGLQVAGRDHSDLENLIGVFINGLVLRFDIAPNLTFAGHIKAAREVFESALSHREMPFNKLVELLNPARDSSRNPLVSVNFSLRKSFLQDRRYGRFELIDTPSQSSGVIYDLNFVMVERPNGWRMSIEYNTGLFEAQTIQSLLDLWQQAYEVAFRDGNCPVSALTPAHRHIARRDAGVDVTGAIEELLRAHPSIKAAAVIASAEAGQGFHAFVTPVPAFADRLDVLPGRLMRHLQHHLSPEVMPHGISVLLNLPTTSSGEIKYSELRIPAQIADRSSVPVTQPTTEAKREAHSKSVVALGEIWRDVLGVSAVGPLDDFFELGGHSLLALRMLAAVRNAFGVKPTLESLFQHPTLDAFAKIAFDRSKLEVTDAADKNFWERVACKSGAGPLTVYTINHPYLYYRLANELADDVSVYNINMFNADIDEKLHNLTFAEIAKRAVDAMEIEAGRPVAIVGLCINGTLAIEVTRQLRERGVDVTVTAVIDAWAPDFLSSLPKLRQRLWTGERRVKRVAHFTQKVLTRRMPVLRYFKEFKATTKLIRMLGVKGSEATPEEMKTVQVTNLLVTASQDYRAADGEDDKIILLRSQANSTRARKLLFGWGAAVAKTTPVLDIDGWHEDSLTSDGIRQLASALSKKLDEEVE